MTKRLIEEWLPVAPSERVPSDINDDRPIQYGMPLWRDLFSLDNYFATVPVLKFSENC